MSNKELCLTEVKKIQMDVLSAIDVFCKSNDIKYSLADGTLLGAIRHQGYIPWDDDIDIVLLRTEYNRLMSEFPNVYHGRYKIASLERNIEWSRPYAVAYDDNTVLVEASREKISIGVKIDIFPVDYLPDNINIIKFEKKLHHWITWYNFSDVIKGSNFFKTAMWRLIHLSTFFYSRRKIAYHIQKLLCEKANEKNSRACELICHKRSISIYPSSIFDDYRYYPFEDKEYMAVMDVDAYLTSVFGDYMRLPPIEERIPHHAYKAYLK